MKLEGKYLTELNQSQYAETPISALIELAEIDIEHEIQTDGEVWTSLGQYELVSKMTARLVNKDNHLELYGAVYDILNEHAQYEMERLTEEAKRGSY